MSELWLTAATAAAAPALTIEQADEIDRMRGYLADLTPTPPS